MKKLDPIRFPFKEQPIGSEKQPIGGEKQPIGSEKQPIESVLDRLQLTRPTCANIVKLYGEFGNEVIFGRAQVMKACGLSDGPAGMLIRTMLRHHLLDTVKGHGKGKYHFRTAVQNETYKEVGEIGGE